MSDSNYTIHLRRGPDDVPPISPRTRFKKDDEWLSMFDWLQSLNPSNYDLEVYTFFAKKTFGVDTWPSLIPYACSIHGASCRILVSRIELPTHKDVLPTGRTVCSAKHEGGPWLSVSPSETKRFLEAVTVSPLPSNVVFGDFCEEYPNAPAAWG